MPSNRFSSVNETPNASPLIHENEENEIETCTEEELVKHCYLAIQGVESKLVKWQEYEAYQLRPFAEKPLFDELEDQDSDEEPDPEYLEELEKRTLVQLFEHDLLDRHCQVQKQSIHGIRIAKEFRYGDFALGSSQVELAEKICYTGTLYFGILSLIKGNKSGIILQSVMESFHKILKEYYSELTKIDSSEITLRSLYNWTIPFCRKFEVISLILKEIKRRNASGGQILTVLYELSNHGNKNIRELVLTTFKSSMKPFFEMIRDWMLNGDANDLYEEFFVAFDNYVSNDLLWHQKYSIRFEMVPSFIPSNLAERILRVGKSIDFMRLCCKEDIFLFDPLQSEGPVAILLNRCIDTCDMNYLLRLVEHGEQLHNKHCVSLLLKKFKLKEHLSIIKKFIFYTKGDFLQTLFPSIEEELNQPTGKIFMHRIRSYVESALLDCSTDNDKEFVKEIKVIMDQSGTGWEDFSLIYKTEPPLNSIFTTSCIEKYKKISKFIWQLKRVEYLLIRHRQKHPLKILHYKPLFRFHTVHNHILRLIQDLLFYCISDCINSAWKELIKRFNSATNLDMICNAHEVFLNSIIHSCLLSNEYEVILKTINELCKSAIKFCLFQDSLFNQVESHQELVKSQLEPSLETFNIAEHREFIRCGESITQYFELYSNLHSQLKQYNQLPHLNYSPLK